MPESRESRKMKAGKLVGKGLAGVASELIPGGSTGAKVLTAGIKHGMKKHNERIEENERLTRNISLGGAGGINPDHLPILVQTLYQDVRGLEIKLNELDKKLRMTDHLKQKVKLQMDEQTQEKSEESEESAASAAPVANIWNKTVKEQKAAPAAPETVSAAPEAASATPVATPAAPEPAPPAPEPGPSASVEPVAPEPPPPDTSRPPAEQNRAMTGGNLQTKRKKRSKHKRSKMRRSRGKCKTYRRSKQRRSKQRRSKQQRSKQQRLKHKRLLKKNYIK